VEKFGGDVLCKNAGVVDIAAGRGNLSAELCDRLGSSFHVTLVEPLQRKETPSVLQTSAATVMSELFDASFTERHTGLMQNASLLVGLHPDQATEAIVDQAISFGIPFAVVPCCVFPRLFPWRRLVSGQKVKTCGGFLRFLRAKHIDIETTTLDFEGRNRVLFWKGASNKGAAVAAAAAENQNTSSIACVECA
jgi:hypothetical protein